MKRTLLIASLLTATTVLAAPAVAQDTKAMGFFVTSIGSGKGGDLGGLDGADAHCAKLAEAAGSTGRTWRAYLSTWEGSEKRGISARDRIGKGPWYNAKGELIAEDLDQLHIMPNLVKKTALDEKGNEVKGRGDQPNEHDMLTGSKDDGTAFFPWEDGSDKTCKNWTSGSDEDKATVGHHDRHGGGNVSWNNAHISRGCSPDALKSSGGAGLFYCFAAD